MGREFNGNRMNTNLGKTSRRRHVVLPPRPGRVARAEAAQAAVAEPVEAPTATVEAPAVTETGKPKRERTARGTYARRR